MATKLPTHCFLARIPHDELRKLFEGYGYKPFFVEGSEPKRVHQEMASTLDKVDMPEIRDWQWTGAGKGRKANTSADNV
jgi:xylulose-5-phosphate/fructose-6-phosphate phosphoketolase